MDVLKIIRPVPIFFALAAFAPAPAQRVADLLDLYLAGEHEAALAPLAKASNAGSIARDIVNGAEGWAARGATPEEVQRRRLAAASLALEFTVLRMTDEWYTLRPLIEWGCTLLRGGDPPAPPPATPPAIPPTEPSDAELAWQRAALAAIQGARDNAFARRPVISADRRDLPFSADHVAHVAARFPSDPAVLFAQGFFEEFQIPVEGRMRLIDVDTAARASARALEHYRGAADDPELAAHAALAIGYIHLRMKRPDQALPDLAAAAGGGDPFVRHLAHLLRGRVFEQRGSTGEAMAAYRAALDAIPNAQAASMALAALLHLGDRPDAAIGIMTASFAARPAEDPWREYGFGQFRNWPRYRDRMREAVR
jgi:tetratricopeptide (TPR) repeat protein